MTDKPTITPPIKEHNKLVLDTLKQVQAFLHDTGMDNELSSESLSFEDINYIFYTPIHHPFKTMVTLLFWYFFYQTRENRIYHSVSYDLNWELYCLTKISEDTPYCGFGFDPKYFDYFYRQISRALVNVEPNTPQYAYKLVNKIYSMFDPERNLIIIN